MRVSPAPFVIAALFFAVFLISFLRDRRKLRNGFFLLFAVFALIPLSVLALGVFLVGNGVAMLRREGR